MAFKHEVCKGCRELCHSAIHLGTDGSSVDECQYFPARPLCGFLSPLLQYATLRGSHESKREGNAEGKKLPPTH